MAKLGGLVLAVLAAAGLAACQTSGQGGGTAGSGLQATALPPGMSAAQGAAYCSKLAQTLRRVCRLATAAISAATSRGGEAADLDARVAIANCQDGNYASGIPVLQEKLRDAKVTVPPPPTA